MTDLTPSPAVTATVGVPSPAPVRIVDDATTNPWDVAAVFSGLLVGIASLVLAWRAVKIGQRANAEASKARAAVAAERRRTFELEVLRDLLVMLDADTDFTAGLVTAEGVGLDKVTGRMSLLGDDDLPRWKAATNAATHRAYSNIFEVPYERAWVMAPGVAQPLRASTELLAVVRREFYKDVRAAIERRMDARDA